MLESVGAADGDRNLANAHARRVAETRMRQLIGTDFHDRQIGVRIVADELAVDGAPVGKRRLQRALRRRPHGCW